MDIKPTSKEVKKWLFEVLKHTCHVEYYLNKLGLGEIDYQRPHDIIGEGNKFSWPVIKGLALQYRNKGKGLCKKYIFPAREIHRQQYHHQMWNNPPKKVDFSQLEVGAIDTLCAHLEEREYQGGALKFEELPEIIKKNKDSSKYTWLNLVYDPMKEIYETNPPKLEKINSLINFPNIGLPKKVYEKIKTRTSKTIKMLQDKQGYLDLL